MEKVNAMVLAHVSGGWAPPWHGMYQSGLTKPCPDGSSSGSGSPGSVPSGPGVNIRPSPGSGAFQPWDPNDKDDDQAGLG